MAAEPIPKDYVVPMEEIAPGIAGLRIAFVNVFGVQHEEGRWTMIDSGLPFSATYIRHWAENSCGGPPIAIVLTHGHFDHVSAARELADEWGVPIYAHPAEFPYLTGRASYPKPAVGAGGGMMSWLSPLYPRGPVDLGVRLRPLPDGELSDAMPGWRVIETPGHTPGHVSFFRTSDRLLLAGDAFCTTKPESFFEAAIAQKPELHGPPAYFTWDERLAAQSIRQLAELAPTLIAPGHGHALAGAEVAQKMQHFAAQFAAEKAA